MKVNKIILLLVALNLQLFSQIFWESLDGPYGGSIEDIVFNSKDYIFSGGWITPGIYRSVDDGGNWEKVNEGYPDFEIFTLAVNKEDHIFIGTYLQGILRSTDDGESWEELSGYTPLECWTITFNDSGHFFAGAGDWWGIYKSTDTGEEWSRISTLEAIRLAVNDSGYIFAGTFNGLHRSINNGATWDTLYNDFMDMPVPAIAFDHNGYIYVGTGLYSGSSRNGVYVSKDNGYSWEHAGLADTTVFSLAITQEGDIFAGTREDGVYLTTDGGQKWTPMNNGLLNKRV